LVSGRPRAPGTWCEHLRSWWPHRNDPNVLFLDYDDLVTDPPAALRRVAAHCGLALDERDLPRIVERCSLDFLRADAARFDPRLRRRRPRPATRATQLLLLFYVEAELVSALVRRR
jgi:hypothetical protein